MHRPWLLLLIAALLAAGCAKPVRQDLDAGRLLLQRAAAAQAERYAGEEYHLAGEAWSEAQRKFEAGSPADARQLLVISRQHALRAVELAEAARQREAADLQERRQREEQARLQAEAEARRQAEELALRRGEELRRRNEEEARKAAERLSEYRVTTQDTLASIAALPGVYADPLLWPLLYQGNRDQIKDPAHIHAGQLLRIPRGQSAADLEQARQRARDAGLFGISPVPANGSRGH